MTDAIEIGDNDDYRENVPSLYMDGERNEVYVGEEIERVQLEFDDTSNGVQTEAQEAAALGWVNSAAISLNRGHDAMTVAISVGDPRGAFAFTVRRLQDGRLMMYVPYAGEPMPHMTLTEIQPGTYEIS